MQFWRTRNCLFISSLAVFLWSPELASGVLLFVSLASVILPLFVSAVRNHKKCSIRNPVRELAGSLSNVWSWIKNISGIIVELHSDHKTHTTAVQPAKLALETAHMHKKTHTHTQRRKKSKGIYLEPVFTHLIPSPWHTALLTSPFLSTTHVCTMLEATEPTYTDYISLKYGSKNITHKTTKLTQQWNFRWSSYWYITPTKRTSQEFHNKCTLLTHNISATQYITTLFTKPAPVTSVHFKASQQKNSHLCSALKKYKRTWRTCPTCKTNLLDAVWSQLTVYQWKLFLILCEVHLVLPSNSELCVI